MWLYFLVNYLRRQVVIITFVTSSQYMFRIWLFIIKIFLYKPVILNEIENMSWMCIKATSDSEQCYNNYIHCCVQEVQGLDLTSSTLASIPPR